MKKKYKKIYYSFKEIQQEITVIAFYETFFSVFLKACAKTSQLKLRTTITTKGTLNS